MDGKAIEDAGEPRPCPFCGSGADQLVVERWSAEDDPDTAYQVECLKCGCNGPQADTTVGRRSNGTGGRDSAAVVLY
jgi:Zn ribbon nucleic-acid-binding protein